MERLDIQAYKEEVFKDIERMRKANIYSIDLNRDEFSVIIQTQCEKQMTMRGDHREFVPTKEQKTIIDQLFLYATGNENFKGSLSKGLALVGPLGTGKTLLMTSFIKILNGFAKQWSIPLKNARSINDDKNKWDIDFREGIFIDDMGKESLEIKNFGNVERPMNALIARKYEAGSKLFLTSNLTEVELMKTYGDSIGDRLRAMLNFMILPGKSLRT